jgi:hypothetical protein
MLQALIAARGGGHVGQWHTDASGQRRRFKQYRRRWVQTLLGPVRIRRASYWASWCQPSTVYPLDERLGLRHGTSPGLEEVVAFTAGQLTYEETAALVRKTLGVRVSVHRVQETVTAWGRRATEQWSRRLPCDGAGDRVAVAVDGAMVRTAERRRKRRGSRKQHFTEHWSEAKLGVIYAFDRKGRAQRQKRYVTSLAGKESFGQALWDRIAASGADRARHAVWLGDGAAWVWSLKAEHLPHAVEVLDFFHARDHLYTVAAARWPGVPARRQRWVRTQTRRLLAGQVRRVLRELRRHRQALGPPPRGTPHDDPRKVLADNVRYFEVNAPRMRYDAYRQLGYPISSGVVESGCKHVIAQRMKITAGMSWRAEQADPLLRLRCIIRSGEWHSFWRLPQLAA